MMNLEDMMNCFRSLDSENELEMHLLQIVLSVKQLIVCDENVSEAGYKRRNKRKAQVKNDLPYRDSNPGLPGTLHSQGSESRIS